jgi:ankyrin repeat protein
VKGRSLYLCAFGLFTCALLHGWLHAATQRPVDADTLIAAAEKDDTQQVEEALRRGVDVNGRGANGATAILAAARRNRPLMVKCLIEHGADYSITNNRGMDALLTACAFGQDAVVNVLANLKADVNAVSEQGLFPLLMCASGDYASTVGLLVESGARVNIKNSRGMSALLIAAERNSIEAATALLAHGADPDLPDNDGWTPLMVACRLGNDALAMMLVGHGVDLSRKNNDGLSALVIAIDADRLPLARQLVQHGALQAESEDHPYLSAMSCYLMARHRVELAVADGLGTLYVSAAKLFGIAAADYDRVIKGKNNSIRAKGIRSALYIGGSALLLVATGGAPIPFVETSERLKDTIKASEARLKRCRQFQAQCDEVAACLVAAGAAGRPQECVREDLSLAFGR